MSILWISEMLWLFGKEIAAILKLFRLWLICNSISVKFKFIDNSRFYSSAILYCLIDSKTEFKTGLLSASDNIKEQKKMLENRYSL